ncbi:phytanoyl-CoA dioxygenase family protein [Kordiimonas aquimaris]|uniref:phytanoyl-CoA dioxygenase family protein n=1 Tax=Kordiimonas aquimaris TaxID=707591 RepID=UPI0021D0D6B1|nr:phytanoyl-CoA dioxygenase family protein [Kordiimonas aquimaris]
MLTEQQRAEFDLHGILKVKSLLSEQAVSRARHAILSRFEALGLSRRGEWRLEGRSRAKWPDKGYSAKAVGNKIEEVENLLGEPGVEPIVGSTLEHANLDHQMFKRPQILVTLPNKGEWFIPKDGWHVDIARIGSGRRPGVQVFILLSEIKPQGGGTLVVSGSHRLLNNDGFIRSRDVAKQIQKKPGFCKLMSEIESASGELLRSEDSKHSNQQDDLSIVELTGSPGDAYFMDLRALHSAAPNISDHPRMMATHRFLRADTLPELTLSK